MLEDKIILQDRGFDAGLAALMQNANKGMDPSAGVAGEAMASVTEVAKLLNLLLS